MFCQRSITISSIFAKDAFIFRVHHFDDKVIWYIQFRIKFYTVPKINLDIKSYEHLNWFENFWPRSGLVWSGIGVRFDGTVPGPPNSHWLVQCLLSRSSSWHRLKLYLDGKFMINNYNSDKNIKHTKLIFCEALGFKSR